MGKFCLFSHMDRHARNASRLKQRSRNGDRARVQLVEAMAGLACQPLHFCFREFGIVIDVLDVVELIEDIEQLH